MFELMHKSWEVIGNTKCVRAKGITKILTKQFQVVRGRFNKFINLGCDEIATHEREL